MNVKIAPAWAAYPIHFEFWIVRTDCFQDFGFDAAGAFFMGCEL